MNFSGKSGGKVLQISRNASQGRHESQFSGVKVKNEAKNAQKMLESWREN